MDRFTDASELRVRRLGRGRRVGAHRLVVKRVCVAQEFRCGRVDLGSFAGHVFSFTKRLRAPKHNTQHAEDD